MTFAAFNAQKFSEFVAEFNAWCPGIERSIEAVRGSIMMQGAEIAQELESQRKAVIRCESRTTQAGAGWQSSGCRVGRDNEFISGGAPSDANYACPQRGASMTRRP